MKMTRNIILGAVWIALAAVFMNMRGLTIWNGLLLILGIIQLAYGSIFEQK